MDIEKVKAVAEPILTARELFLVDLKVSKENAIEVVVDAMQGVNIRTCIEVSREIEAQFDRGAEDFALTVSSAGIGCPFQVEGQYAKNLGKEVEVKMKDNRKVAGTLKAYDAETVTVEHEEKQRVEGSKKKQVVAVTDVLRREEMKEIRDVVTF